MLANKLAVVDAEARLGTEQLTRLCVALAEQIQNEFAQAWHRTASVTPVMGTCPVPSECWPVYIRGDIGEPHALGVHLDDHNQPYALVDADSPDVSVTISHEALEMIGDPSGNRLWTAAAPYDWVGPKRVKYLVEVCDPCEHFAYQVGGVDMSDFVLPTWYRSADVVQMPTHLSTCAPREVGPGGYVSWMDPATDVWWQRFVDDDGNSQDVNLGVLTGARSFREAVDAKAREFRAG